MDVKTVLGEKIISSFYMFTTKKEISLNLALMHHLHGVVEFRRTANTKIETTLICSSISVLFYSGQ